MIIRVDIDETICTKTESEYDKAKPIQENIEKINKLYDEGHKIIYWTSRGMLTGINWRKLTFNQLNEWGCKFNELEMNKPFYDMIVCDKSKRIEELF